MAVSGEAAVMEEGISSAQSPMVAVTFQRNVHRKQKYLEAEPKSLGITQIGLSMYQLISTSLFMAKGFGHVEVHVPVFIASLLVVVAGSVAVAAQNLHLPTLKACLGMQITACVASMFNIICALINTVHIPCYDCDTVRKIHSHFYAGALLIHAALLAISVTLAVYCCKVLNCCVPSPKMPVITIQASMSSTEETVRTSAGK